MKRQKKYTSPFVAIIPTVILSCSVGKKTSNPPEPMISKNPPVDPNYYPATEPSTQTTTKDPSKEPAAPEDIHYNPPPPQAPAPPPVSKSKTTYGKREKAEDGSCYVRVSANPPYRQPVSCTAPIQKKGSGCEVASANDPKKMIPVECE